MRLVTAPGLGRVFPVIKEVQEFLDGFDGYALMNGRRVLFGLVANEISLQRIRSSEFRDDGEILRIPEFSKRNPGVGEFEPHDVQSNARGEPR